MELHHFFTSEISNSFCSCKIPWKDLTSKKQNQKKLACVPSNSFHSPWPWYLLSQNYLTAKWGLLIFISLTCLWAERGQHDKTNVVSKSLCNENLHSALCPLEKREVSPAWLWFFIGFWYLWRWSSFQTRENRDDARSDEQFLSELPVARQADPPVSVRGIQSPPLLPVSVSSQCRSQLQHPLSPLPCHQTGDSPINPLHSWAMWSTSTRQIGWLSRWSTCWLSE